ncbi:MAG: YbbR-like domain-containing protein [Sphingobacteriaceae bacterium]|nr:MAG: YbbR-like domain-containing protein [Sphingobacteriaceae bacterium]
MPILKLSATEKRRVSVFGTCLVLAVVAWLAVTFSRTYNFKVKQVLAYKNAPKKRAFHSLQSDTVDVIVRGTGWQMLSSKMNSMNPAIKVDLRALEYQDYLLLSDQVRAINKSKEYPQEIVSFYPDTLYFDFSHRRVKRVPVRLAMSLKYQQQYAQSDDIVIKPKYVTISGPSNVIDKITHWETDSLRATNLSESINTRIRLSPVKEGNIGIYPNSVQVKIPVNEFTEKTIEVPVTLVNNREYYRVNLLPKKVKVTFTTPIDKYAGMTEEYFEAEADLNMWKNYGYKVLPVKITQLPDYCRVVKIEPPNIDFIIKK